MDQTPLSHVTDKELGKANADHHYRGWCIFERLVKSETCSILLQEAKSALHHTIFNRLGKQHIKKDSRKVAKTSVNGERVLEDIRAILRRGLIIGDEHLDGLGRGGSFLQTPPGCVKQAEHFDFDFIGIAHPGRRCPLPPYHNPFILNSLQRKAFVHLGGAGKKQPLLGR
jgi:hypothetical protein